jgi:L,D-transpeptidase ErfK/SrfK
MIFNNKVVKLFFGVCASVLFISTAHAEAYYMPAPGDDIVGQTLHLQSRSGDTLVSIGNRYGLSMHEMLEANKHLGLQPSQAETPLGSGKNITVPTQFILPPYRKGIVVNLPELRLYYFSPDNQYVYTYPLGLGRDEWRTPLANSSIIEKEVNPTWNVPKSIHKFVLEQTGRSLPPSIGPGPDNPLGPYAMRLSMGNYLIHGTNQPWTIGKYVSSGCIRMFNSDVEELYQMVKVGTPVHIINHDKKAGWLNGQLYLESQEAMDLNAPISSLNPGSVRSVVMKAVGSNSAAVDWNQVNRIAQQATGVPQRIGGYTNMGSLNLEDPLW